ncbi:MAG: hypothetical protein ACRCX8_18780 [Sarcina sp.]
MNIILNEKVLAEKVLGEGLVDKKPSKTISLLARYYNSEEMDKEQIIDNIDNFMSKHHKAKYNSVTWSDLTEGIVDQAIKNNFTLNNVESVNITKSEIDFIKNIGQKTLEKLAFTYLVYAKILNQVNPNNNNWINENHRTEIFKDANVTERGQRQLQSIFKLKEMGIISMSKNITNNSINVENYINESNEVILVINDFREIGLQYLRLIGEKNIVDCQVCGKLIIKKPRAVQKYCSKCKRKKQKEWDVKSKENKDKTRFSS